MPGCIAVPSKSKIAHMFLQEFFDRSFLGVVFRGRPYLPFPDMKCAITIEFDDSNVHRCPLISI